MSMIIKWRNLNYLNDPNSCLNPGRSQALLQAIEETSLLEKLKNYLPTLMEPHALGMDSLDETVTFFTEVYAVDAFRDQCEALFGKFPRFQLVEKSFLGREAICLRFHHKLSTTDKEHPQSFSFEIIGQPLPIEEQHRFQVTVVADRLLRLSDDPRALKQELMEQRLGNDQSVTKTIAEVLCDYFDISIGGNDSAETALIKLLDADEASLRQKFRNSTAVVASAPAEPA